MRRVLTALEGLGTGTSLIIVAVAALFLSRARPAVAVPRKPTTSPGIGSVLASLATRTPSWLTDDYLDLCRAAGL